MKKKKRYSKTQKVKKQRKLKKEVVIFQEKPTFKSLRPSSKSLGRVLSAQEFNISLFLIPLILLVILGIISLFANRIEGDLKAQKIGQSLKMEVNPYAYLSRPIQPPITAEAAMIMDSSSKVVLYKKNADSRFSMASTTKLMTALVAMEYFKPQDILTVTTPDVPGQTLGFPIGEQLYFEDLVYAMLLPSSNHAANVIAHNYPGGYNAFIAKMNEKAKELSLTNTQYVDPAGLNDQGNYTTARDLAMLSSYVSRNQKLASIAATKYRTVSNVSKTSVYRLSNLNILLGQNGVVGLKTGYTEGAGGVLTTLVNAHGRTFVVVVMRSQDRFADTQVLLSYLGADIQLFTPQVGVE